MVTVSAKNVKKIKNVKNIQNVKAQKKPFAPAFSTFVLVDEHPKDDIKN